MTEAGQPVRLGDVFRTWLPLAASWLVMAMELPAVSATVTRLTDPELHLAAYGGVVLPVSLIIEAPVMMLLAASVALARDRASHRLIYRFMMALGVGLTALHALLAFTPLFDLVIVPLLGPPASVVEPARMGLKLMRPWTWAIAYRRFHQGLLIRFGRSHHVTIGTALRLVTVVGAAAFLGFALGAPGVVTATLAVICGVTVEALYSGLAALPVVRKQLDQAVTVTPPLTVGAFLAFFLPLLLTSLLSLLVQPLGSAALARMPEALASLAVWPIANGLLFMLRSVAFALNEVVVALLDRPGAYRTLRRFTWLLGGSLLLIMLAVAFTPLSRFWFGTVSGLSPSLAALATVGFTWALLWPSLDAFRNLLQGVAVHAKRTAVIGSATVVFLGVSAALLVAGIVVQRFPALPVAMFAFVVATLAQVVWLSVNLRRETAALAGR
ncbi:MAG: hypothetical protein IT345_13570 [Trueperaceae bacterium]|nr:hypothetical protein [Trueperaceae bacterium]